MATTPTQTSADIAREIVTAVGKGDFDTLRARWSDETVVDFVALDLEVRGATALEAFFGEMHAALPDLEMVPVRAFGEGDSALVEWRMTGTFTGGPFQGIHPTGRAIELRGVDVMEFAGGKLAHEAVFYDGATFARQVGMLPPMNSAGDRAMTAAFNAVTDVKARFRKT